MRNTILLVAGGLLTACASHRPVTNVAFEGDPPSRSFRFTYHAELPAEGPDEHLRMWIPVPVDTPEQEIANLTIDASHPTAVHAIGGGTGRSLYLESTGEDLSVTLSFDVTRHASAGGMGASAAELEAALAPNAMIPLDGKVATMAASLPSDGKTMHVARALYDHTLDRMRYDKPVGGDWGRGDAEWACDSRFGNCTDFHSYFIGLARKRGIPARFVMGFPVAGGEEKVAAVGGYHCWAYFWDDAEGWRPVDISEADKHPEKAEYFFGNIDQDRVEMVGGRDIQLTPAPAAGRLNLFIYPYTEVDGQPTSRAKKAFERENL